MLESNQNLVLSFRQKVIEQECRLQIKEIQWLMTFNVVLYISQKVINTRADLQTINTRADLQTKAFHWQNDIPYNVVLYIGQKVINKTVDLQTKGFHWQSDIPCLA